MRQHVVILGRSDILDPKSGAGFTSGELWDRAS